MFLVSYKNLRPSLAWGLITPKNPSLSGQLVTGQNQDQSPSLQSTANLQEGLGPGNTLSLMQREAPRPLGALEKPSLGPLS